MNQYLERRGIRITTGTISGRDHYSCALVDQEPECAHPEMHQTRKGKQLYFGLKAHIGVDSKQGHVHSVCTLGRFGSRQAHAAGNPRTEKSARCG